MLFGLGVVAVTVRTIGWRHVGSFVGWLPAALIAVVTATRWKATDTDSDLVRVTLGPADARQDARRFGPIPFEAADRRRPIPWRKVRRVRVTQADAERARITLSSTSTGWVPRVDPIDTTVRCSPQQAAAVRSRIERWRTQSIDN